jgi:hypothetical protein
MERLWNSKDNMIMVDRVGMIYAILDPERLFGSLALGTVTVATAVVTDLISAAMVTPILMTTQGRAPAFR